jgi:peptidoglycan/LPS O-acetylase OafA/YrhL
MDHNVIGVLSMVIPMIGIIMGVSLGMVSLYLRYRTKRDMFQLYHIERMSAIDKGIELPPLPPEFFRDARWPELAPVRHRRAGLVLLFLGIAVTVALWGTGVAAWWWGLVPVAIGLALLLSSVLEARDLQQQPRPPGGSPADP